MLRHAPPGLAVIVVVSSRRCAPPGNVGSCDDGRSPGSRLNAPDPIFPNQTGFSDPPPAEVDGPTAHR
jgi:hypothetical protein